MGSSGGGIHDKACDEPFWGEKGLPSYYHRVFSSVKQANGCRCSIEKL